MKNIIGIGLDELKQNLTDFGLEPYRAAQIWQWLYHQGVTSFDSMSNLPLALREKLKEHYVLQRPTIKVAQKSQDGTQKWLLSMDDGNEVECVHIPEETRGTLCVSSQVGCVLSCTFCHTGTQRYVRNLTAAEVLGQIMLARDLFAEWPSPQERRHVSNIVMMGMGEPLYNYDNVAQALKIATDPKGLGFSHKKITLSTSGMVPNIIRTANELRGRLAISLHAVTDELRDVLVPLNKQYPLSELLEACRYYASKVRERITFEYVMLQGINDEPAHARELIRLIRGIPAKVNLIPFNPWPGTTYECSTPARIQAFAQIIENAGYASPVRTPRGEDILAACGQLKSESTPMSKNKKTACSGGAAP